MAPSPASFPKLSNRNYQQWRLDMEARLRTLGAMRIVQGTESRPHFTEPLDSGERRELRDYDSRVDAAAGEIWNCVEREQQTHLEAIRDDPGAMWTKLESVHMQKRPGTRFNTYNALLSLSKADDESLSTLLTRASQLKSDMKALRPADFDLSKLDDELVLMALIRALPAEYNTLRQTLLLDDSLTLEKLQDTFVALENQPGAPSSTPALSHAASTLSCTFCGRSGHSEDQCFAKRDASTKAKEKAAQRTQYQRSGKGKRKETASEASKDAKDASDTAQESAGAATVSAGCASALLSTSDRASWLSSPAATNWNTDTGASAHMTPHRHWFRSYSPHVIPIRLANSHIVYSAGLGSVVFQPAEREGVVPPAVVLHDVLHVPALASNLLSVFHLTREKGYTVELCASRVLFYHQGQLRFEASVNEHNVGYLLGCTVSQAKHALSASSTCEEDESLWHQRCSHVNLDDLRSVVKKGLVSGLVLRSKRKPDPICEPCLAGKLNRHSIPRFASRKHTPIALVHTDLKGPLPVPTPEGHVYWMTFVCDATRFWVVAYLKRKSDAFAAFQAYKAYAENCLGLRIKATRDDKGGEYIGREYNDFCAQHGIQRQHTEPDEPHQNGVAERANRTIAEGATALLAQSKLPPSFWGHAVSTFVHTRNRMPTSALGGAIPYTAWKGKGRKPDVSYFRTFGCLAYVLVRKKDRKALEPHSRKCIFVGYPEGTKAWRFWDPAARRFIISSHAVFDEHCFPGNSPSINVFGLPLDEVNIPGDPATADKPPEDVPDAPELPDQGGDDWDDPAPPAPPAPPPAAPAPPAPPAAPAGQRERSPAAPERAPSPPAPPAPAPVVPQPPAAPAPAPVPPRPPVRPSVHQQAEGHGGFRPYPALARKHLPARSTRFQGSLNNQELERRNLVPQRLRIGTPSPAATPEPSERGDTPQRHSPSPDPLIDAPVEPEPAPAPAPAPPAPPPSPTSSDDELDLLADGHEDVYECSLEAMLAGIEDVYCSLRDDYLTYDDALAFAFESVAEHALKASQEHFGEPRSISEVMQLAPEERDRWLRAAQDEIQSLVENRTFELVQLPPGRKAIGSRWVFRVKRNADGSIERYKGRLVAKGFSQRPGFDYNETFAPTPKWASIRAILALAALEDLELESVDISSAYLNGELKEEVYMKQPEGFEEKSPDWVWRLRKSLYGLKQAGRCWHEKLHEVLTKLGFDRLVCKHSVWVYLRDGVRIIIPVFVDDITIASKSKDSIQRVKDELRAHFKLRDLGPTSWLLGVKIERNRAKRSLSISQRQYALDILERYGFANCDPVGTPMDPGLRLSADMGPSTPSAIREMQDVPYGQAVGSLFYLAVATRPDIARTVGNLARFSKNPGMAHWKAVKHLFRYIKGTLDYKLTYSPSPSDELFTSYTDADHAGCPDTGRSTSGYVIKMGTGAISWSSRLQSIVALSTTEAEFVAAVSAGQEVLWLRNLLTEFGFDVSAASRLRIDNLSALSVAKNPEHHGRMKHLDLRFYWLRDEVAKGRIEIEHLRTSDMPADILTKSLAKPKVLEMVKMLGLGT
ncbi:hypothetical protein ACG7TL_007650 [Trametes sanguinea]